MADPEIPFLTDDLGYSPEYVHELRRLLYAAQEQVDRCLSGWEETLELNHQLHARIAELVDDNAALRQSLLDAEALLAEARSTPEVRP